MHQPSILFSLALPLVVEGQTVRGSVKVRGKVVLFRPEVKKKSLVALYYMSVVFSQRKKGCVS